MTKTDKNTDGGDGGLEETDDVERIYPSVNLLPIESDNLNAKRRAFSLFPRGRN